MRLGPLLLSYLFIIGALGVVAGASVQVINGTQPQVVASYPIHVSYNSVGVASPVASYSPSLHVGYSSSAGASPGVAGPASAVGTGYFGLIIVHHNETGQNETIIFWPPQNETVTQPPSNTVTVTVTETKTETVVVGQPQPPVVTAQEQGRRIDPKVLGVAAVAVLLLLLLKR